MPRISRRNFTLSAGATAILSPFLGLLDPPAKAATGKKVKRVLIFCSMGTDVPTWTPSGSDSGITFSSMTSPLSAVKSNIVIIDGMPAGNPGDGHGAPDGLTGLGYSGGNNTISVDQFIAEKIKAAGVNTPVGALLVGARTQEGGGRTMFYNRSPNCLSTISSPLSAFTTCFGNVVTRPPTTGTGGTSGGGTGGSGGSTNTGANAAMAALLKRRKSTLDLIKGEINGLKGRLGATENAKLDLHLTSLRQVEDRVAQAMAANSGTGGSSGGSGTGGSSGSGGPSTGPAGAATCTKPGTPSDSTTNICSANELHSDIIVSAFACDVTRVAAIEFGSDQSLPVDLASAGIQADQHGGMLHSGAPGLALLVKFEQYLCQRFVDLVTKLKAIPEADGSGSLFDNTLMVWARDMGDAVNHNMNDMRFVLAGGAAGYLKTSANGRYIHASGVRHERVLLNVIESMGITNFSGFGDPTLTGANKAPYASLTG